MIAAWFETSVFTISNYIDFLCRLIFATVCGCLIGAEREKRFKNAGLRTHTIVCLASAVMMMISKYAFFDIVVLTQYKIQVDAARIAAGVVQAIGFLGAGIIFIRKENVIGLTTAAGLWATVGIGLAFGAGFYTLGIASTCILLLVHYILQFKHAKLHSQNCGNITCNLERSGLTPKKISEKFKEMGISVRSVSIKKNLQGSPDLVANVVFNEKLSIDEICEELQSVEFIDAMDIYPVF